MLKHFCALLPGLPSSSRGSNDNDEQRFAPTAPCPFALCVVHAVVMRGGRGANRTRPPSGARATVRAALRAVARAATATAMKVVAAASGLPATVVATKALGSGGERVDQTHACR
eukprot:6436096-Prymnesium_polylepis.1